MADIPADRKKIVQEGWSRLFSDIEQPSYIQKFPSQESLYVSFFEQCAFDDFDLTLLRFLKARKFVVTDSSDMLANAIVWRQQANLRSIMVRGENGLNQNFVKASMYFIWGQDKKGRAIVFLNLHNFIPPKNTKDMEELKALILYAMENARLFLDSEQNAAKGVLGLVDLTYFSRKNIDLDFARVFAETFQNYYPEILGQALIVGSGFRMALFEGVWSIGKYFLDPEVRSKVTFCKPAQVSGYVDSKYIPLSMHGQFDETKLYERAPPETAGIGKPENYEELDKEYVDAAKEFIRLTREWIYAAGKPQEAEIEEKRKAFKYECKKLWRKGVALRPPNIYQRLGLIDANGHVDWSKA
ncbi:Sec14 cytosolic factor family protein [Schizosaccharomyces pombe]|uniref:CRAL-TRIO domain-containing protein C365.01 n=1 Tax=Schizosaccharomyces pombe (strain 972 / ATCC 24843) TaxID=284812 RepID=YGR1_SCHPO|nr:putative sec14 family protein [Schizosaccharomyces pombe]Q9UUC2.1 RecName: Full=CRAL-TRIO domain-containing protein C365.01 [Schizosaccharomyces pombe 972h-]CAB44753.1 sec14 cytosolic factor family (predicted) [Schizosaccharomyces pombe]|eukprot:NP_596030.1 putative sec14 family protein [Schizosaccharomyces pombe]